MELSRVASAWIEMWSYEVDDPARDAFEWVSDFEYEAEYHNPDLAIDLVLEILKFNPEERLLDILAAGPLEQVLANHGSKIIGRVEFLSESNARFACLLAGVWRNGMTEDIWNRVQKICNESTQNANE